jgi:hypothetical protein
MSKTRVPAIPAPTDTNLRDVARAVKGVLDVREGLLGDPLDRTVTFRDLVDGGIVEPVVVGRGGGTGSISVLPAPGLGSGSGGSIPEPDLTPPPAPTGFAATAGLAVIILEWAAWTYGNHAYTEIWRSPTDVIGNAVLIGTSDTRFYNDAVGQTGVKFYYWVRFRSEADVVGPYNDTEGTDATTGKIGNVDLGPLIVEAGNLASGAVTATKLAAEAVEATKFASGIEPVSVVTAVPTTKSTNTIYNSTDGKLYRWNGTAYVASVPTTDLTGQIEAAQIADAALTTAKFASGIEPVTIVTSLPTTKSTNAVFNTTDGKLYRWDGTAYVASVPTVDLSGTIEAAQIAAGAVDTSKLASDAITSGVFAPGYQPLGVVTNLPPALGYTGPNTVFQTSDSKIYRYDGVDFTSVVEALDIDSRGLDIKDLLGNTIFDHTGEIAPTAYVNVNSNNVLISDVAANALVPSLNYVGAFASAPTQAQLGAAWKQNSVYKNTTDGKSYVLTGAPLAWVEYLADGQLFLLVIESTNGTIFRVGGNQSTLLKARLFKNGAEVTDQTPESWFRWRRVSAFAQAPPNDDATWNGLYSSGYRQVSINVDSVNARATFFCDILSP